RPELRRVIDDGGARAPPSSSRVRMSRLALLLLILPLPFTPASADDYLATLKSAAHAQGLQDAPEWRALLHHQGGSSEAVTPGFFLAVDGAHDPAAELDATL